MHISIQKPCSENWQTMTPADKGRFCAACQKCVVDFTAMTDAEIVRYLNQNKGNNCGRFTPEQLNRQLETPNRWTIPLSKWVLASTFSLGFMSPKEGLAAVPMVQTEKRLAPSREGIILQNIENEGLTDSLVIRGVVLDSTDAESIIGASIVIKGTTLGVLTDIDGIFYFRLPIEYQHKDIDLTISFLGYETKAVTIKLEDLSKKIEIKLGGRDWTDEMKIVAGLVEYHKPTLWQRIKRTFRKRHRS